MEQDNLELLLVEVRLSSRNNMLLGNFYRAPDSRAQPLKALADTLTDVSHQYNHICFVGYFILPFLQWNSSSGLPTSSGSSIDDVFVDAVMTAHGLQQVNFSATQGNNILGLVLCSELLQVFCGTGDNVFPSDHNSVRISLDISNIRKSSHVQCPVSNFRKADLNDMNRTMECIP